LSEVRKEATSQIHKLFFVETLFGQGIDKARHGSGVFNLCVEFLGQMHCGPFELRWHEYNLKKKKLVKSQKSQHERCDFTKKTCSSVQIGYLQETIS
jgi:hypothetical protein